jgi:hypothetical protein
MTLDPRHVAWSHAQFHLLRIGGVWAIPRSGLIFTRTDETTLTLTARMPYQDGMEDILTPDQLNEQQQDEYEAVAEHMRAAGVTVTDETREG